MDVTAFERFARQKTRKALERAADLYTGDLLAGLSLREAAFEEWLRDERDRLREAALQVLGQLLAAQTSATDLEPAVQTAVRLLALEPMHEAAHRALMDLYDRPVRAPRGQRILPGGEAPIGLYCLIVSAIRRQEDS